VLLVQIIAQAIFSFSKMNQEKFLKVGGK